MLALKHSPQDRLCCDTGIPSPLLPVGRGEGWKGGGVKEGGREGGRRMLCQNH